MGVLFLQFGPVVLREVDHQQLAAGEKVTRDASAIAAPGCWA